MSNEQSVTDRRKALLRRRLEQQGLASETRRRRGGRVSRARGTRFRRGSNGCGSCSNSIPPEPR